MQDLFTSPIQAPLAERLRPKNLDEVVGQQHLIGEGKPLRVALESGIPHSMLLWGSPGIGKTTLARILAQGFAAQFLPISAVFSGVKDIREAISKAEIALQQGQKTILFVDEVHRFNKAQQDAFLPYVESGLITFIFSLSVVCNSLQLHGLQHTRLPHISPTPRACSNSCPSSR